MILGRPELGDDGWRWLFVAGVLPAFFALWIRRNVREPEAWTQARAAPDAQRESVRGDLRAGADRPNAAHHPARSAVQFAYWGIFFWLPAFLARPVDAGRRRPRRRPLAWVDHPGADRRLPRLPDVRLHRRSAGPPPDVRAVHDRRGDTRPDLRAAWARSPTVLMLLGPVLGYFGHGYFSMFGSFVAELFPTPVRGTGSGHELQHRPDGGRRRAVHDWRARRAARHRHRPRARRCTSAFFLLAAALVFTLPDRSGQELES